MNPWTALLESLHSALIDEITERHPEPKPELGMPARLPRYAPPAEDAGSIQLCDIQIGGQSGLAALACDAGFARAVMPAEAMWNAVFKRAGSEFSRRSIQPRVGRVTPAGPKDPLPPGYAAPGRMIWIPIRVPSGRCWLGVGI